MANPIELPDGITLKQVIEKVKAEDKAMLNFQKRRFDQWNENYLLYRDKIAINRLTQRQAVNVPIIKETIRTILPKIDEEPNLTFEDRGGSLDKEIVINHKWLNDYDTNNFSLVDVVDKKQVLLYGRSHKKLNWANGEFSGELKEVFDLRIDPNANPINIDSARYLRELNIMRALEEIMSNNRYDKDGKDKLYKYIKDGKKDGSSIARSRANKADVKRRNERLLQMGADSLEDFDAYDHVEELNQHFTYLYDKKKKKYIRYVVVLATTPDDVVVLRARPMESELGVDFWPFEGWADDLEITDYWSDSIADMLRVPNQILNVWLSQLIENRTFRNFGMNFYDSTIEGFDPTGFEPRPFGWYPLPGKPSEVYQPVEVPQLSGTIEEMQFIISLAEKASATSAIDKGVIENAKRTLGEIEIAVGKAQERTTSIAKFYRLSWKRYAEKWYQIMEANAGEFRLYKKAANNKLVGKTFKKEDWASKEGYKITADSNTERTTDEIEKIQRLTAIKQEFPDNAPLQKAIQKRLIRLGDLTPEEAQEIEQYELQKITAGSGLVEDPALVAETGNAQGATPAEGQPQDFNGMVQQILAENQQ